MRPSSLGYGLAATAACAIWLWDSVHPVIGLLSIPLAPIAGLIVPIWAGIKGDWWVAGVVWGGLVLVVVAQVLAQWLSGNITTRPHPRDQTPE